MKIAEYVFPKREEGSCGYHKLAHTSLSLLVMIVMLLFCLTTCIDLLPTQGVYNLSRLSGFSALFSWQTTIIEIGSEAVDLLALGVLLLELESKASELSESMRTLAEMYLLLEVLRLILSVSLNTLTT